MCMLYIENALSMRALQEMMSADNELVNFNYILRILEIYQVLIKADYFHFTFWLEIFPIIFFHILSTQMIPLSEGYWNRWGA